jgi:hypothetical protein
MSLGMNKNSYYFAKLNSGMWRLILITIILLPISCFTDKEKQESIGDNDVFVRSGEKIPEIKFDKMTHDFGKIYQGEVVGANFSFKNTGNSNLLVLNASASCGCTIPKWSKEPLPPGSKGSIEVIFDSSGRVGVQKKSIVIRTNTINENILLYITAEVITEQ